MKKIIFTIIITIIYSCDSNDRGELTGIKSKSKWLAKSKWFVEKPLGMTLIPSGSFTMGKQDEADIFSSPERIVTVRRFYMDETEITNSEYKQFVYWVRDSVIRTKLAYKAEDAKLLGEKPGGIRDFAFVSENTEENTENLSLYEKWMEENHYNEEELEPLNLLNWREDIIWDTNKYPDEYYIEAMYPLYIEKDASANGNRIFNNDSLNYRYSWFDRKAANKSTENKSGKKDFLAVERVNIYPDTVVWAKDFNYSYNDPILQNYFYHQAYGDYPVVGVNWHQAKAFCNWRTKYKNDYLKRKKRRTVLSFRLPTEEEWEYAARGGLDSANPWEGIVDAKGKFLANFKSKRANPSLGDGDVPTMEVKSFKPNDYGLYDMAGNVSEWTNSAYNFSSYYVMTTINPNVEDDRLNKRKTIRGGSWKDAPYFLKVDYRNDYEYADTTKSYIGFRTVQSLMGDIRTRR